MYKSPTNKTQYWNTVYEYWEDLFKIMNIYLPTFLNRWIDKTKLNTTLGSYLIELKNNKNPRLVRAFHAAYWNIPNDIGIWDHPKLNILYDLCLAEDFLHEEREEL